MKLYVYMQDHQFSEESVAILSDFDLTVDKVHSSPLCTCSLSSTLLYLDSTNRSLLYPLWFTVGNDR